MSIVRLGVKLECQRRGSDSSSRLFHGRFTGDLFSFRSQGSRLFSTPLWRRNQVVIIPTHPDTMPCLSGSLPVIPVQIGRRKYTNSIIPPFIAYIDYTSYLKLCVSPPMLFIYKYQRSIWTHPLACASTHVKQE